MISRRENLLKRPWEQRRYDHHRRKVQSAAPAIDTKPPVSRQHVILKLKKKQNEIERIQEIERNNLTLLRRLNCVMRTNRVDNYWKTPQPRFLNRETMYDIIAPKFEELQFEEPEKPKTSGLSCRKLKCQACNIQETTPIKIPEERVPWEPDKISVSRVRSKSVPVRKIGKLPETKPRSAGCYFKTHISKVEPSRKQTDNQDILLKDPQSIILTRGCLELYVNFPSDASLKLREGSREKVLLKSVCSCKVAQSVTL